MSRLSSVLINSYGFLSFATFVVAVTALLWVSSVTCARADTTVAARPNARNSIRDPKIPSDLTPAARARAQRAAAIKKARDTRKFILDVVEGKASATSDKPEKGVAK